MREVFIHQDSARVGLYKSVLDGAEIPNFVRNGLSNNSVADMPSPIFFPALCVLHDEDYEQAIELLRTVVKPEPSDAPDWKCPACGETVPGTFDTCWKCSVEREAGGVPGPSPAPQPANTASAIPPAAPTSMDPARALAVVNAFRWLLIIVFLWTMLWRFGFPFLHLSVVIQAPPEAEAFFEAHNPSSSLQRFAALLSDFHWAVAIVAFALCFCLVRLGRAVMVCWVIMGCLQTLGVTHAISSVGWYSAAQLYGYLVGAILVMMYLPPLSGFFSRKA